MPIPHESSLSALARIIGLPSLWDLPELHAVVEGLRQEAERRARLAALPGETADDTLERLALEAEASRAAGAAANNPTPTEETP